MLLPREIDVQIDKIQVSSLPADHPLPEEAVLSMSLETKSGKRASKIFKRDCVVLKKSHSLTQNGQNDENNQGENPCESEVQEITNEKPGAPLVKFSVTKDEFPKLKVKLDKPKKSGLGGLLMPSRRHSLASSDCPIDLFALLPKDLTDLSTEPTDFCLSHTLNPKNNQKSSLESKESNNIPVETNITLEMSNERFGKPKDTCFKITVGAFYDCFIPEDIEPLWGPIPLQKLPKGEFFSAMQENARPHLSRRACVTQFFALIINFCEKYEFQKVFFPLFK